MLYPLLRHTLWNIKKEKHKKLKQILAGVLTADSGLTVRYPDISNNIELPAKEMAYAEEIALVKAVRPVEYFKDIY